MAPTVAKEHLPSVTVRVQPHAQAREYIFKSRLPDIDIPNHLPLVEYVFSEAWQFHNKTCILDGKTGKAYTYAEVERTSKRVAAGVVKLGLQRGEVVLLLLPNCPEFVLIFLGVALRGAVVTTANPLCTPRDITKQALASGAKIIVTVSCYAEKLTDLAAKDIQIVTIDAPSENCIHVSVLLDADENECPMVKVDPDEVVALPYSSGTTGLPKGVMLTHKNLVTNISQQVDGEDPALYYAPEDVVLCLLPLFHIYSLCSIFLCALRRGSTLLIMPRFEIVGLLEICQKYRVTVAPFVPPIVLAIAKSPLVSSYDLSSVRLVLSGAAPLGKDLEDAFKEKLPQAALGQGFGMTEAGPVLAMSLAFGRHPNLSSIKPGSCGTVVRNSEVKVVDPETGESLSYNQPGEFCIRGAQVMKGYLNDPESTALTVDKEGWLHTGDVGYIDEDDEVFIVDRVKEIIKYKGFQVPPAELEALLVSHPAIADAAVVPKMDETAGEVPVAFVVRAQGSVITNQEIKDFVANQVVFYKRLHSVIFTDSIPKSPSGKILRKDLRSILAVS
ncbi:hypothetical protein O6H91_16G061100 [Diphasiastrum complanatum]|uniref:Uncharacterized protein n=1 Tax=Diphasiastrum complanatum TaxID=34168 RepID=A0ACC2BCR2_DIPCM|nr:hypothetical protein O6H91_16G061100 [Diphasiastrum complanatum]